MTTLRPGSSLTRQHRSEQYRSEQHRSAETVARVGEYNRAGALAAEPHADTVHIVTRGEVVGALTVPATLGLLIRQRLKSLRERCPILAQRTSGAERWTFLTNPAFLPTNDHAMLMGIGAIAVEPGATVLLPSPFTESAGQCWWIWPPIDSFRPELARIVRIADELTPPCSEMIR